MRQTILMSVAALRRQINTPMSWSKLVFFVEYTELHVGWKQIDVGTVKFYPKLSRIIFSIQNHFDPCNLCMQFYKLFELVHNTIINIILQLKYI